jgi:hypothetical protein
LRTSANLPASDEQRVMLMMHPDILHAIEARSASEAPTSKPETPVLTCEFRRIIGSRPG